jgi:hypothetical protein
MIDVLIWIGLISLLACGIVMLAGNAVAWLMLIKRVFRKWLR